VYLTDLGTHHHLTKTTAVALGLKRFEALFKGILAIFEPLGSGDFCGSYGAVNFPLFNF